MCTTCGNSIDTQLFLILGTPTVGVLASLADPFTEDGFLTKEEITKAYGKSLQGAWKTLDHRLASNLGMDKWNFSGLCFSLAQALLSVVVHEEGTLT